MAFCRYAGAGGILGSLRGRCGGGGLLGGITSGIRRFDKWPRGGFNMRARRVCFGPAIGGLGSVISTQLGAATGVRWGIWRGNSGADCFCRLLARGGVFVSFKKKTKRSSDAGLARVKDRTRLGCRLVRRLGKYPDPTTNKVLGRSSKKGYATALFTADSGGQPMKPQSRCFGDRQHMAAKQRESATRRCPFRIAASLPIHPTNHKFSSSKILRPGQTRAMTKFYIERVGPRRRFELDRLGDVFAGFDRPATVSRILQKNFDRW